MFPFPGLPHGAQDHQIQACRTDQPSQIPDGRHPLAKQPDRQLWDCHGQKEARYDQQDSQFFAPRTDFSNHLRLSSGIQDLHNVCPADETDPQEQDAQRQRHRKQQSRKYARDPEAVLHLLRVDHQHPKQKPDQIRDRQSRRQTGKDIDSHRSAQL